MSEYGNLYEKNDRYVLEFDRVFQMSSEEVFRVIANPDYFSQWYPFATGEMDLKVDGKIKFDDGEGSTYEAKIIKFDPPHSFSFQEVDDLLQMELHDDGKECRLNFRHTFDDRSVAMYAAGWHRCLDALAKLINGQPIKWENNAEQLRDYYSKVFQEI